MAHTLTSLSAKPNRSMAGRTFISWGFLKWEPNCLRCLFRDFRNTFFNTQKRTNHDTNHLENSLMSYFQDQNEDQNEDQHTIKYDKMVPWISLASWTCEYWKRSNPTPTLQSHWTSECWVHGSNASAPSVFGESHHGFVPRKTPWFCWSLSRF